MADYIKVSARRLGQDREQIQEEIKGIHQAVEELSREMQLLGQTWEGPAWQAFQNQLAQDIQNMQEIYKKLSEYLNHMEYAQREYTECENRTLDLIERIRV